MKRVILIILGLVAIATVAFAGTIKPNGMNQGDLYNLLSKIVTIVNELKTDHNELVTTNAAAFGAYSSTVKTLDVTSSDLSLTQ